MGGRPCPRRGSAVAGLAAAALLLAGPAVAASRPVSPARSAPPPARLEPGRGKLLVAGPALLDPNFARSVVLLLETGAGGAVGVILNRPSRVGVAEILPRVAELERREDRLFVGGPVEPEQIVLLVRTAEAPPHAFRVLTDVYVTSSLDALRRAAAASGVRFRLFAGYAGWAAGQLEAEIARGDWLVRRARADDVFSPEPKRLWKLLIEPEQGRWVQGEGRSVAMAARSVLASTR